jgi:hypothetical protein
MSGPGDYVPDPTAGITNPEELPQPKVVVRSRNYAHCACPRCHHWCGRNNVVTRVLHGVGDLVAGRPGHHPCTRNMCPQCQKCFGGYV